MLSPANFLVSHFLMEMLDTLDGEVKFFHVWTESLKLREMDLATSESPLSESVIKYVRTSTARKLFSCLSSPLLQSPAPAPQLSDSISRTGSTLLSHSFCFQMAHRNSDSEKRNSLFSLKKISWLDLVSGSWLRVSCCAALGVFPLTFWV